MENLPQDSAQVKKIIELNEELENYFRNTVIPQLFVDAHFILRKFTPPAMKQFNFKESDIGRNMGDLGDNIRFPTLLDDIKEVIKSKEDFEKEIQTTDLRWYQMNILPYLIQKENRANGVIITFIDITDRINSLKEVENLNADHEIFIYAVSHDLKGPISNAEGLVRAWKGLKDKGSKESLSIMDMLSSSIDSARRIIDELGDVSRTRHNLKAAEKVNFENILADVQLTLKDTIYKSGAIIRTEIKAKGISFSRKNLRSILYNLLINAIKFKALDRTPEIFIKTEDVGEYTILSIKDNGMGIAKDKQDIVFSEFSRINNTVEGTGIGLYIISKMIDDNGGKIEVESTLGQGTTFVIYFKNSK